MPYNNLPPVNTEMSSPMPDVWQKYFMGVNDILKEANNIKSVSGISYVKIGAMVILSGTSTSTSITLPYKTASDALITSKVDTTISTIAVTSGATKVDVTSGAIISGFYITTD